MGIFNLTFKSRKKKVRCEAGAVIKLPLPINHFNEDVSQPDETGILL